VCLDLVDVIAINTYPGWYHRTPADIPEVLDGLAQLMAGKGFADKPLMIGEIGAEGLWGWRDWHARHWTEQYQAQILENALRHLLVDRTRWCGVALWQFCDVRSSEALGRTLGRARGFNNKGLVDEYRRPKLAYDTVKRLFRQARRHTC
jgi:beta-glucuronidase